MYELIFMKGIEILRAESWDVMCRDHCLNKRLAILWLYDYDVGPVAGTRAEHPSIIFHLPLHDGIYCSIPLFY